MSTSSHGPVLDRFYPTGPRSAAMRRRFSTLSAPGSQFGGFWLLGSYPIFTYRDLEVPTLHRTLGGGGSPASMAASHIPRSSLVSSSLGKGPGPLGVEEVPEDLGDQRAQCSPRNHDAIINNDPETRRPPRFCCHIASTSSLYILRSCETGFRKLKTPPASGLQYCDRLGYPPAHRRIPR